MSNNSNALQIETLEKELKNTEVNYEEAYKNYLSLLKSPDAAKVFTTLTAKAYWGDKALTQGTVNSVEECQAMCSSNTSCTGATYNSTTRFCFARSGEGNILPGSDNTFAIMTKMQEANLTLKALNDKILGLIHQLNAEVKNNKTEYEGQFSKVRGRGVTLRTSYDELMNQRIEIDNMLNQYETIQRDYSDTNLQVKQRYFIYKFFYVLMVVVILITLMIVFNINTSPNIVLLLLVTSLLFYVFEMITISAVVAFFTVIYVIL
jgi:hypothetical protein